MHMSIKWSALVLIKAVVQHLIFPDFPDHAFERFINILNKWRLLQYIKLCAHYSSSEPLRTMLCFVHSPW